MSENADKPAFPGLQKLDITKLTKESLQEFWSKHRTAAPMTRREYFAAMAMQGLLSGLGAEMNKDLYDQSALAQNSVLCAEALIKELEKTP